MVPPGAFWHGKRVLITGHTGFKGSWLSLWLMQRGARVTGLALPPSTEPNLYSLCRLDRAMDNYFCDIRVQSVLGPIIHVVHPDIVLHLAAQPLVRAGYQMPVETMATNIMGTVHLLEALRRSDSVRVVIVVTTDKVYKNDALSRPFRESDPLGGHDPYSASKAACESVTECYRASFLEHRGVAIATARAGNVIGGGDWSADRLIPDAIRAWSAGHPLPVRRPNAVRPWQHVLEPLLGYMRLAERLWDDPSLAGPYNFGPPPHEAATVREVVELARLVYGHGEVVYGDGCDGPHEEASVLLEPEKTRALLGVGSQWSLRTAVERTVRWYRHLADGQKADVLCEADIGSYEQVAVCAD